MTLGLLIPLLLPDLLPKLDEESARTIVEWLGYRRVLLLPILVLLGSAFVILSRHYVFLHNEQPSTKSDSPTSTLRPETVGGTWEQIEEHRLALLKNLAADEKKLLRQFLDANKRTMTFGIFDPVANGLTTQGILVLSNNYPDFQANYMVSDWAWKKLKENPKLLR